MLDVGRLVKCKMLKWTGHISKLGVSSIYIYTQRVCGESWKTAESERITLLWIVEN